MFEGTKKLSAQGAGVLINVNGFAALHAIDPVIERRCASINACCLQISILQPASPCIAASPGLWDMLSIMPTNDIYFELVNPTTHYKSNLEDITGLRSVESSRLLRTWSIAPCKGSQGHTPKRITLLLKDHRSILHCHPQSLRSSSKGGFRRKEELYIVCLATWPCGPLCGWPAGHVSPMLSRPACANAVRETSHHLARIVYISKPLRM